MKKIQDVIITAVFCVIFLCSCSFSYGLIETSGQEEETAQTEEPQLNDSYGQEEKRLLEGLQLNDPEDLAEAVERILKKDPYKDGKVIDSWGNVTDYHCEAGILISACQLLKYREGDKDQDISDMIDSVNDHLMSYVLWDSEVFCPDRKGDMAAVVTAFQGLAGMSHICPTIVCYTRDGGSSWDYYFTNDEVTEFTYTEDGCFAYLCEFTSDYGAPDQNALVFCDTLDGKTNRIDIGFDRRGLSFCEEEIIDTDILSIEDPEDGDRCRKKISIGYRVWSKSEAGPYFCKVRFPDDEFYNIFDSSDTEILSADEDFMRRFRIILQSEADKAIEPVFYNFAEVDFVFPDSNARYLTREEIEDWKVFTDRLGAPGFYLDLLERAKNEIYARRGYDFSQTGYELFDQTLWYRSVAKRIVNRDDLNEFERYNVDLLDELLMEEKE